ncbi:MAG: SDR family NAD(P)-dependent oxidoreductase [Pseudomonadales bacterium]
MKLEISDVFSHSTIQELGDHIKKLLQGKEAESFPAQSPPLAQEQIQKKQTRIESLEEGSVTFKNHKMEPMAIVGVSGRFPGASTLEEFWEILSSGVDAVCEVPANRWDTSKYYDTETSKPNKTVSKWAGILQGMDEFDPGFFNISPKEAELMDPQQRLCLEESWKAFENAGYSEKQISGEKIGVFIGVRAGDYLHRLQEHEISPSAHTMIGNDSAILASRISYYLNLKGPAISIDTACSSSLVALQLAAQSILAEECTTALVGGVHVFSTERPYLTDSNAGMLSPSGKCKTFDHTADGIVPGEAVGMIVIKPLNQAIQEHDQIYGIVKGIGINQDGKTNGITAPNSESQSRLFQEVYERYQVNPQEISYVEAHGTGTKLGDPIEIKALSNAFRKWTLQNQFCAIGSVKTNVGHTIAAAGMVSLIKVLLAMKHQKLPATLHYSKANEHINFKSSPFYVNQELTEWQTKEGEKRLAAISSFGFSGTNVHVVLQEAPKLPQNIFEQLPLQLVSISAKTKNALEKQFENLLKYLERSPENYSLEQISYTLNTKRTVFQCRSIFIVESIEQFCQLLKKVLDKEEDENYLIGEKLTLKNKKYYLFEEALELLTDSIAKESENIQKYKRKLFALGELYLQGCDVDWKFLYRNKIILPVSLPGYPFAKEKYWIDTAVAGQRTTTAAISAILHPLLHSNTSDLIEQNYTSTFSGEEFFLRDHQVNGQKVLPGVAYLEMARAAISQASPTQPASSTLALHDIVWVQPIVVTENKQVTIALFATDDGAIDYEITSTEAEREIVHCQGQGVFSNKPFLAKLDIEQLRGQMQQGRLEAASLYPAFAKMGLNYGASHQGVTAIYQGDNQLLAQLNLPAVVESSQKDYLLHPSLMDSALQSTIGLIADINHLPSQPWLPFALESVEVLSVCTPTMWVWVRYTQGSSASDTVQKLDIDLCDEQGTVCVRMRGFSSRLLEGNVITASSDRIETLMVKPVWRKELAETSSAVVAYTGHRVFLCGFKSIHKALQKKMPQAVLIDAKSKARTLAKRFKDDALQLFAALQTIIKGKPTDTILIQVLVPNQGHAQVYAALSGLLKTAQLENPKIVAQVIAVEADASADTVYQRLEENSHATQAQQIRYEQNIRLVAGFEECIPAKESTESPWKARGVYLITGGAGGLGLIFSQAIAEQAKTPTLILTGRSALDKSREAKLETLRALGAIVEYKQVDVTDKQAVHSLVRTIEQDFGPLNGILHSAGINNDNFILKKTREEFAAVLAPKVAGTVNLDEASQDVDLDFFVLFSSLAGSLGNAGQADYATANGFMDAYAHYRNDLVATQQRHGQSLSVNWPLWQGGGMGMDATTEQLMKMAAGMVAMQSANGLNALVQSLSSGASQVLVMEGDRKRFYAYIEGAHHEPSRVLEGIDSSLTVDGDDTFAARVTDFLKKQLAQVLKLPAHRIQASEPLENYGIDSILAMQLTNALEKTFGSLSKTLFFEYQTIQEVSDYFIKAYRPQLLKLLQKDETPIIQNPTQATLPVDVPLKTVELSRRDRHRFSLVPGQTAHSAATGPLDIAIIGLSGKYPQAENLEAYWHNLREGKDCITEIPAERWDWRDYYTEDRSQAGRHYSKWGGFIADVDKFDPLFFNISPREAELMDPQERLFLEHVWMAMEDAGYARSVLQISREDDLPGQVGVYAGVMYSEYQLLGAESSLQGQPMAAGGVNASIANRVSYFLNLYGPSLTVDTMCSSSLTSIHLACQDLKQGRTDLGIAGGVNISIHPNKYLLLSAGQFISSRGHCESFGKGGEGYIPGEGVGVVLLKRLSEAVRDEDSIYGVIKGSAVNHGGKTNGYTVPNPNAQQRVISQALKEAQINPRTISYIEAHGTGTKLGDPIEITGLVKAFSQSTDEKQYCAIGSAKSNIGHCESAAGIAGLTKVLLQMRHGQLVPSLHSEVLNPNIDFENTPFVVNQALKDWQAPTLDGKNYPRIAGISSFGAGGSNAHLIIEEYVEKAAEERLGIEVSSPYLIVLSAKNEERLSAAANNLKAYIANNEERTTRKLSDIAYTLQVGREAMEERLGLIVTSQEELQEKLQAYLVGEDSIEDLYRGQVKRNKDTLAVFTADEELQEAIGKWIQRGKYAKLLDLWVKGLVFDWNKLYGGSKPRRISLPTYPFAKERYWVPEDRGQRTEGRQINKPVLSLIPTALADPLAVASAFSSPGTLAKHSLSPLEVGYSAEGTLSAPISLSAASCPIALYDYGQGVFCIKVDEAKSLEEAPLSLEDLNLGLAESFRVLAQQTTAKVVILDAVEALFLSITGKDKARLFQQKIPLLPLHCPVPVIAVMKGDCSGFAWLLGSACDLMICNEAAAYDYCTPFSDGELFEEEFHFFATRFGDAFAQALVIAGKRYTGKQLRENGLCMPIVAKDDIDDHVLAMAYRLAQMPRQSLCLLKQHLAQEMVHCTEKLLISSTPLAARHAVAKETKDKPALSLYGLNVTSLGEDPVVKGSHADDSFDLGESQSINIGSEVVHVEAYQNGILVVRLVDKASKNTFSEEFLQGITEAFDHIRTSSAYKVVILTGYDQYFACGGTKDGLLAIQDGSIKYSDAPLYELPLFCDIPVIAAMQGHGIGAGWSLGMFCDINILSEESVYTSRFMEFGFTPGFGSTLIFPARLGQDLGREVLLTANEYKGETLKDRGINIPIVPRADVYSCAIKMANQMVLASRERLIQLKIDNSQHLRSQLKTVIAQELAMHDRTFIGNEKVLQNVQMNFQQPVAKVEKVSIPEMQDKALIENNDHLLDNIRKTLKKTLAEELHIKAEYIDDDMPFVDLGLDSITGVMWMRKINQVYDLSIEATKVYNYPTLAELSTYLLGEGKQQGCFAPARQAAKAQTVAPAQHLTPAPVDKALVHPTLLPLKKSRVHPGVIEHSVQNQQASSPLTTPVIAVIGMAGQFPQANTLDEFWENLSQGKSCISEIPAERWLIEEYYDPDKQVPGKTDCKWMGVLDPVAEFDPLFFNISPREAELMDPQQRLFLQNSWHCIEEAGYNPMQLSGSKCGVFVGCGVSDYGHLLGQDALSAQGLLGAATSILAARIAYLLNLQGPCLSIDTACSSSLVAIASACDSLVLGGSDLALAGGVCVMAGPSMHIMASKAGMLSAQGRCFTFDQRADGFVPGEGVGVVLLKRLEDATRDGDRIAGVIRGWGVNQDGKTNGITAPNPDSQARLAREVYQQNHINPEQIQLIEAHGTGTKLGDPIEIEGLKTAFNAFTDKTHYCALGSVKSNIGHLLPAAGVSGVIKLLLALKHRQIPPTIHYERLNEHINLEGSPFYINTENKAWAVDKGTKRRAAISSFGFSGTNAHLVIEEYVEQSTVVSAQSSVKAGPQLIVLSAKNEDRLKKVAHNLHHYLTAHCPLSTAHFQSMAYTLQVGREAMQERLAMIVTSEEALQEKLIAFLDGEEDIEDIHRGQVNRNKETLAVFTADEELQEAIGKWIQRGKYSKLLSLWAKGLAFDWNKLYGENKPRRISLPTYPFAKERYWVPEGKAVTLPNSVISRLHPLVHENTSTLSEQRFSSTFTGEEFFLKDHQIKGQKVLPGVAYLEMARAAIAQATETKVENDSTFIQFSNIVWASPLVVGNDPQQVHIGLLAEEYEQSGKIAYEIYTQEEGSEEDIVVFSQGVATVSTANQVPALDLTDLQTRTKQSKLSGEQCYKVFKEIGIDYGPSHQGIAELFVGSKEVLAKLSLPSSVEKTHASFILHPSLLDAALQASLGLMDKNLAGQSASKPALPFALESLDIFGPCNESLWAWVRYAEGSLAAVKAQEPSEKIKPLDIDLCNDEGVVCARMRGLQMDSVALPQHAEVCRRTAYYLKKGWQASSTEDKEPSPPVAQKTAALVIIFHHQGTRKLAEAIASACHQAVLLDSAAMPVAAVKKQISLCTAWIDLTGLAQEPFSPSTVPLALKPLLPLQMLLEAKPSHSICLLQVTQGLESYQNESVCLAGAASTGLYRMLQSEYSAVSCRHLDLAPEQQAVDTQAALILEELNMQSNAVEVCYRHQKRYTAVLEAEAFAPALAKKNMHFNKEQVLLVTGGTRGLGLLCARHLVTQYGIKQVVLTGREVFPPKETWDHPEQFSASIQEKITSIQTLEALGASVRVLSLPLDNIESMHVAIQDIESSMGSIVGIIHAAGMGDFQNPAFIRKSPESMAKVLSPKIQGTMNLLQTVDTSHLKFALLFSSVSAIVPTLAVGQSDYAMANAFMDYYAEVHHHASPVVSIQWPSWKESGMGEVTSQAYANTGLLSITDQEGLDFLDHILANLHLSVVMPVMVDPATFNAGMLLQPQLDEVAIKKLPLSITTKYEAPTEKRVETAVKHQVQAFLQVLFEAELKMQAGQLDEQTSFADYGVDSILLVQILQKLNRELNLELDPSILLEYPTLESLTLWLVNAHPASIVQRLAINVTTEDTSDAVALYTASPVRAEDNKRRPPLRSGMAHRRLQSSLGNQAIAVIGMACRFPKALDIDAYWALLSQGHSAIEKIPETCWGLQTDYYAGLIDDIYGLDPDFFMLSLEDAQAMDPQALVLLEESLKALYHAGYTHESMNGSNTGVYIGARSQPSADASLLEKTRNPIMTVGQNYLAANLSQFFNFHGPALVIDTACSSSLVAMKMAAEALQSGTIDSALVGGVSLLTNPSAHALFAQRHLLQEDGQFHILDRRATGIVLGEGAGMVLLKPLSQAEKDGDCIYAVIDAIAINNDGRTAGPATPNIAAQKAVMLAALQQSSCKAEQMQYLDINGSGSEVTDLLEIKAIESVYRSQPSQPFYLGSMKPNIGHPLCAEGMASFIKLVLSVHHQCLVPFLSGQESLEHYSLEAANFVLPRVQQSLDLPYAALNCFADGGTNAHVILKQYALNQVSVVRAPLTLPMMNRVDIRTLQPLQEKHPSKTSALNHVFTQSTVWQQRISIDHPIIKNHQAYGQELLPGLAWIDLLYQWFDEIGMSHDTLELKHLSIYRPLIVSQSSPVELKIEALEETSYWKLTVSDLSASDSQSPLYITAEMHRVEPIDFDEVINLEESIKACEGYQRIETLYQQAQTQQLNHTGMMKAEGRVYTSADVVWMHIVLNKAAQITQDAYLFHPTLMDGSVIGSSDLFSKQLGVEKRLFLPLFYESFRASKAIRGECYTRLLQSSVDYKNELINLTLEFFNITGKKIGELKNFKIKLVRHEGLINPDRREPFKVSASSNPSPSTESVTFSFASMDALLTSIIASQLRITIDLVDINAGYYELGLDSARLLDVVRLIGTALSTRLSPTLLFEYTTIASLSQHLTATYGELNASTTPQEIRPIEAKQPSASAFQRPALRAASTTHSPLTAGHADFYNNAGSPQEIAVIGMAGRYPQASNLNEFWENLKAGKDCITEIPADRWDVNHFDGLQSASGKALSKWGGFIAQADCFDPQFFRISPREAETMDPQERLFLEACWEAVEDAGYTPENIVAPVGENQRRPVGVFVGVMHKDYTLLQNEAVNQGQEIPLSLSHASIANRVSYFCNFHGPSMAIDTLCSSSLTALHLAIESIQRGESRVALAGGVNLSLHPNKYMTYGMADMHSSDGYCHTFGKGGDGYVSAEGIGAILLKPLHQAIQDRDHIYATIKGSVINHVGKGSGMYVPNPVAQGDMIQQCFEKTGIDPRTISYIEAHGTGTSLGDPIEIQGLVRAFSQYTQDKQFCSIGSVKSNIGHAESAAGISGLSKVILQLYHKTLVPSLHSETVNPYIDLPDSPFYIQHKTEHWKQPAITGKDKSQVFPRRAGLSAFGATGSNVHIILEEYTREEKFPITLQEPTHQKWVIIPLSAKNKTCLKAYAKRLFDSIKYKISTEDKTENKKLVQTYLQEMAYTLQVGREAMEERLAFLVRSNEELCEKLQAFVAGENIAENFWQGCVSDSKKALSFFNSEDVQEMINKWFAQGKLHEIVRLWVQGFHLDWECLYGEEKPYRISLPTYPFARESYWINQNSEDSIKNTGDVYGEETEVPIEDGTHAGWQFSSPVDDQVVERHSTHFSREEKATLFVQQLVAERLQKPLDEIETTLGYVDMGLTSAAIVSITKELRDKLDAELLPSLFFEYTTISDLSSYLVKSHADAIDRLMVAKKAFKRELIQTESVDRKIKKGMKEVFNDESNAMLQQIAKQHDKYFLEVIEEFERGSLNLNEVIDLIN